MGMGQAIGDGWAALRPLYLPEVAVALEAAVQDLIDCWGHNDTEAAAMAKAMLWEGPVVWPWPWPQEDPQGGQGHIA